MSQVHIARWESLLAFALVDEHKTAPFSLGAGRSACLLLHGFTGSPWDMRPLGEALAGRGYHVKAIRLPGHGTTPEAMLPVGAADWEEASLDALLSLEGYSKVFLAGLSMGALLSVLLAARRPERVHGLALLAPAMRFSGRQLAAARALRNTGLIPVLKPWIKKEGTDIEDEVARAQAPILERIPSARFHDLWQVQDRARELMGRVRAPALIAMARHDHVVTLKGGRELQRGLARSPSVRWLELGRGFHILPRDRDGALLADEVGAFFDRLSA